MVQLGFIYILGLSAGLRYSIRWFRGYYSVAPL